MTQATTGTPTPDAATPAAINGKSNAQRIERKIVESHVLFDMVFTPKMVPWGKKGQRQVGMSFILHSVKLGKDVEVRACANFNPIGKKSYAGQVDIWQLPPRKGKESEGVRHQGVASVLPEFQVSPQELRRAEDLRLLVNFQKQEDGGLIARTDVLPGMVIMPDKNWEKLTGNPVPFGDDKDGKPIRVFVELVEDVNKCWAKPPVGETVQALTVLSSGITRTEFLQDRVLTLSEPFVWEHFRTILGLGGGDFTRAEVRKARNRLMKALHPDRIPADSPAYTRRLELCQQQSGRVAEAVKKAFAYLDREANAARVKEERAQEAPEEDPKCIVTASTTGERCRKDHLPNSKYCGTHKKVVERTLEAEVGPRVE